MSDIHIYKVYRREEGSVSKALEDLGWDSLESSPEEKTEATYIHVHVQVCLHVLYDEKDGEWPSKHPKYDYIQPNNRCTRGNNKKFMYWTQSKGLPGLIFVSAVKDFNTLPADVLNSLVNAWLIQKQAGLRVVYYAKPVFFPHATCIQKLAGCVQKICCWLNNTDTEFIHCIYNN